MRTHPTAGNHDYSDRARRVESNIQRSTGRNSSAIHCVYRAHRRILFLVTVFGFFYVIATLTGQVGLAFLVTAITMANAVREMIHRIG